MQNAALILSQDTQERIAHESLLRQKYLSFDFDLTVSLFLSYSLAFLLSRSLALKRSRSLALLSRSQALFFSLRALPTSVITHHTNRTITAPELPRGPNHIIYNTSYHQSQLSIWAPNPPKPALLIFENSASPTKRCFENPSYFSLLILALF